MTRAQYLRSLILPYATMFFLLWCADGFGSGGKYYVERFAFLLIIVPFGIELISSNKSSVILGIWNEAKPQSVYERGPWGRLRDMIDEVFEKKETALMLLALCGVYLFSLPVWTFILEFKMLTSEVKNPTV